MPGRASAAQRREGRRRIVHRGGKDTRARCEHPFGRGELQHLARGGEVGDVRVAEARDAGADVRRDLHVALGRELSQRRADGVP